ncbi:hypothetical protein PVAG01_10198 [Phlyctema vagabunda]|uniref:Uncharacterized protein n=1 Tax=Phlyctema vagabunda TaxID=108571 RepID=A0ABR4P5E8_9HELO
MLFKLPVLAGFAALVAAAPAPAPVPVPLLGGVTGTITDVKLPKVSGVVSGAVTGATGLAAGVSSAATNLDKTLANPTDTVDTFVADAMGLGYAIPGKSTIQGWCTEGHCYAGTNTGGDATAPFTVTCNTANNICTTTLYGAVTAIFANGRQIELWGWLTPAGYCGGGVCTGSLTALGDPMY